MIVRRMAVGMIVVAVIGIAMTSIAVIDGQFEQVQCADAVQSLHFVGDVARRQVKIDAVGEPWRFLQGEPVDLDEERLVVWSDVGDGTVN